MEPENMGAEALVRHALVDALALEVAPAQLSGDQPLYEHPVGMDSLGFHRVIVELEVLRKQRFDTHALERTLFETVSDLVQFVASQEAQK